MKLYNSFPPFKSFFIMSSFLFFTSCMMFNPGHFSTMHQTKNSSHHSSKLTDPVCGNSVELNQNTISVQHLNNTYYFDSQECMEIFQNNPASFVKAQQQEKTNHQQGYLWGIGSVAMLAMMLVMVF